MPDKDPFAIDVDLPDDAPAPTPLAVPPPVVRRTPVPVPAPTPAPLPPTPRPVDDLSRRVGPPRPAPTPVAPVAIADVDDDNTDGVPKNNGRKVALLAGLTLALGAASAGLALMGDEIRAALQGSETKVVAPPEPVPPMARVTPSVAPTVTPRSDWTERSNRIGEGYTVDLGKEIAGKGARASLTIECQKDSFTGTTLKHAIPGASLPTISWNVTEGVAAATITTNYGEVEHPWTVCEKATGERTQWTSYLK